MGDYLVPFEKGKYSIRKNNNSLIITESELMRKIDDRINMNIRRMNRHYRPFILTEAEYADGRTRYSENFDKLLNMDFTPEEYDYMNRRHRGVKFVRTVYDPMYTIKKGIEYLKENANYSELTQRCYEIYKPFIEMAERFVDEFYSLDKNNEVDFCLRAGQMALEMLNMLKEENFEKERSDFYVFDFCRKVENNEADYTTYRIIEKFRKVIPQVHHLFIIFCFRHNDHYLYSDKDKIYFDTNIRKKGHWYEYYLTYVKDAYK